MTRDPREDARRRRAIATGIALALMAVGIYAYVVLQSMPGHA
jgi:hypothetical protein